MTRGWLALRTEVNRLDPQLRRMIGRLRRSLHAQPWEVLRGLIEARIARREILAQQHELRLLADSTAEGGRWLVAIWNAQRRDTELLALLDRMPNPADQPPTLQQYLQSRATAAPVPAAAAVAATVPEPLPAPADAATGLEVAPTASEASE